MSKRTPQLPDGFSPLYAEAVAKACANGRLPVECNSHKEAETLKFSFYRYIHSMQHWMPEDPRTKQANRIVVRIHEHMLELTLKDESPMLHSLGKAVQTDGLGRGVDPIAETVTGLDEEMAELYRLEREGKLPHQLEEHEDDEGTEV